MTNATPKTILAGFLLRDPNIPFNNYEAMIEADRVASCKTEKEYFRVSRKGSTVPLTRKLRSSIWGLWENAQRHAEFSMWLKENNV